MPALLTKLEQTLPATLKLMPWLPKATMAESLANVPALLKMTILGRMLVGFIRVGADAPPINPNPVQKRDKYKTFFERIFIETFGTIGGFGAMQLAQDGVSHLSDVSGLSRHPASFLKQAGKGLAPVERQQVAQALASTFGVKQLKDVKTPLTTMLYKGPGNLAHFQEKLHNPALYAKLEKPLAKVFSRNQALNNMLVIPAGLVASMGFSGYLWQKLNDGWFRSKVLPKTLNRFFGPEMATSNAVASSSLSNATTVNSDLPRAGAAPLGFAPKEFSGTTGASANSLPQFTSGQNPSWVAAARLAPTYSPALEAALSPAMAASLASPYAASLMAPGFYAPAQSNGVPQLFTPMPTASNAEPFNHLTYPILPVANAPHTTAAAVGRAAMVGSPVSYGSAGGGLRV